tara:strand:- start:3603 stop:5483 length:1881 start_codon:yes stop_codon:yes gene_type:complete
MNFWHIQLHPNNQSEFPREKVERILKETHYIGMGQWEDGWVYIDQFTNVMKPGDIVLVRSKGPLALVEVIGLPEKTSNPNLDFDWFENRRLIKVLQFFDDKVKEQIGKKVDGTFNPVTFASANTSEFIKKWYSLYSKTNMLTQAKSLLEYKKQIILQGPPGTGKTRLAKEIAQSLTSKKNEVEENEIKKLIRPGLVIPSSTNYTHYTVLAVSDSWVQVQLKNTGSDYKISFKDITNAFYNKLWEGGQKNGSDPYAAAIAKYIFKNQLSEFGEFKLIQFHPAYSYEDFVRGIVVETEGGNPTYTSVDKVFAEMANLAHQNYLDSLKSPEEVSKEKQLEGYLEVFKDEIESKIEIANGKYILDGTTTYLFDVDDSSFRYTGDNWNSSLGHRLYLKDILILFLAKVKTRKEIKANHNVSGSARQHSSYYLRVLQLFEEFMEDKTINKSAGEKTELKNFVLIIDEINRANLPSVLGELIYGLEYRSEPVESMYTVNGSRTMVVPPNLFVIGTMNTADRSVSHIDYAIRRRFAFVDVLPSSQPIIDVINDQGTQQKALKLFAQVSELFGDTFLNPDFKAKEVQLGHSYFLAEDEEKLRLKLEYEIKPLLREYIKDGILKEKASTVIEDLSL